MDNVTLSPGTGGAVVRTKDRAGIETSIVGIDLNPFGTESLMAGAMPVSGTFWQATQPVSIAAPVAVTQSGPWSVVVTDAVPLSVVISGTVPVTGTFWQATQPVSGAVTTNAGTNTSTAALALETGGNLAVIAGAIYAQGSTTAAQNGPLNLAACTVAPPIYTTGKSSPLSLDTSGNLRVLAFQSGGWNISTITNPLPAGTNLLGQISASNETATVYNGSTAITPQFALIQLSATGTVVSATAGKRIRVLKWSISFSGTVNVKWQSHTTPTDLTGLHYGVANATGGGAPCPWGHFQTNVGEALDLNLSAAVAVGGELVYILV